MIELEPEHCEIEKNKDKVDAIFDKYYVDEYRSEDTNNKIIEELKKIEENRLAKLYSEHKDYNAMMAEILGWNQ
jgi:hypothetical protein